MAEYRKKLVEVALPLDAINRGCEEDKNRKTGHIRNLHKWFAPMPLPAWRAMLFATVVDDPGEYLPAPEAARERERLLRLVADLSEFDAYKDNNLIAQARAEVARTAGPTELTVVDPFCGGGSTVLEAQRLGLKTIASDLNPVPVLITTVLCRIPGLFGNRPPIAAPRHNILIDSCSGLQGFIADVRHYALRIREIAWGALAECYPPVADATPFAYRWAWTVASPEPAARGRHTPLVSNWWLSRRKKAQAWARPAQVDDGIRFTIQVDGEPQSPTTARAGAACLHSGAPIPLEYVRGEGRAGRLNQAMFAIAARRGNETIYVAPDDTQLGAAARTPATGPAGIPMPDAALGFRVQQYGITNFADLFTRRQAHALEMFAGSVRQVHNQILTDGLRAGLDLKQANGGEARAGSLRDATRATSVRDHRAPPPSPRFGFSCRPACTSVCRTAAAVSRRPGRGPGAVT